MPLSHHCQTRACARSSCRVGFVLDDLLDRAMGKVKGVDAQRFEFDLRDRHAVDADEFIFKLAFWRVHFNGCVVAHSVTCPGISSAAQTTRDRGPFAIPGMGREDLEPNLHASFKHIRPRFSNQYTSPARSAQRIAA